MPDIAQLADLWREFSRERARGGQDSLHGYRFQLIVALRDTVRAFLDEEAIEPAVFVERVSDIYQRKAGGEILFTQVKLTGWTVAGALEELWSIYSLASNRLPSLVPQLHFRILCSSWELKDVDRAINRWQPNGVAYSDAVKYFKERVSWATDPNPLDELLVMVASELDADRPLPTVHSWIGQLGDPAHNPRSIWSDLWELRRKRRAATSRLYVWPPEARPPKAIERGEVLISEQPQPKHLKRGYFAERSLYRSLAADVIKWVMSNPWERDPALRTPVLWLGGRSGCGKSVALLHILSELQSQGIGPILWLGSSVELLPEAVRRSTGVGGSNDQVIIGLDDPYAPRTQGDAQPWGEALAELEQLQGRATLRPPLLLCCGPTGQARQLREDFLDRLNIHTLTVSDTLEDRQALISWFEQRTGKTPPDVGSGDVLLVQLFFEWRTGQPISSFALRFRKRLEEADPSGKMRDVVFRIVALNRLYTGYPLVALNSQLGPEQQDAFESLLREHHFAIDEDPGRRGVWITHPHLANALFEAWLPVDRVPHQRKSIFKDAILDGLRYGDTLIDQTAPLWALARLNRSDESLRKRLEADRLETSLPDLYATWYQNGGGSLSFGHLPAWIEVQFSIPTLHLKPKPVSEALARLLPENHEEFGFLHTYHKILDHWRYLTEVERQVATQCITNLLTRTREWGEWPSIASHAVLHIDDVELRKLTEAWLLSSDRSASYTLQRLLRRRDLGPNYTWMLNLALSWVQRNEADPLAGYVLRRLLKRRDLRLHTNAVTTLALNWLQYCPAAPVVEQITRLLLGVPMSATTTAQVVRLALDSLEHHNLQEASAFLLGAILRARVLEKVGDSSIGANTLEFRAIRLGLYWLELYENNINAPYIADRLLRLPSVSDTEWLKIASKSLARLRDELSHRDADYTLISITYRRHLLSEQDNGLLNDLLRAWLKEAKERITKSLFLRRFLSAGKRLAPALPLAAHLGDAALLEEFETMAKNLRNNARDSSKIFDDPILSLLKAHSWPSMFAGRDSLRRIGLVGNKNTLISRIKKLIFTPEGEEDPSLTTILDDAIETVETALREREFRFAGYHLSKIYPLAVRIGEPYLTCVESLTRQLMSSSLPINARYGFIKECENLLYSNASPRLDDAPWSFDRAGFQTPMTLEAFARSEVFLPTENVARTLNFVEELFESVPMQTASFWPPLLILVAKSGDETLIDRYQRLVLNFFESSMVTEGAQVRLAYHIKRLAGMTAPNRLRTMIEVLGLQGPWLEDEARALRTITAEQLKRHIDQATQLLEQGFLSRAGILLAPLIVIAVHSREAVAFKEAGEVALRMLAHPRLTNEQRDGFRKTLNSLPWPELYVQDVVFQILGVGAPMLDQLLLQPNPSVQVEVLRHSLDRAANHLLANRMGGVRHILLPALPLASWVDDEDTLERTLELAHQFLNHPSTSPRLRERFSERCIDLLREERWRDINLGQRCLTEIGVIMKDHRPIR